jgi:hypothetical protein
MVAFAGCDPLSGGLGCSAHNETRARHRRDEALAWFSSASFLAAVRTERVLLHAQINVQGREMVPRGRGQDAFQTFDCAVQGRDFAEI